LHFRGPLELKQFAAYLPSSSSSKRDVSVDSQKRRRHGHQQFHKREQNAAGEIGHEEEKRTEACAAIDGKYDCWTNTYSGASSDTSTAASVDDTAVNAPSGAAVAPSVSATVASVRPAQSTASTPSASLGVESSGSYTRSGYYDAASGTLDNLVFLANLGGGGSGVFDDVFGNSLSYVDASGTVCASDSTVLGDIILPSDTEIIVMSGEECSGNDCGYYRPGSVAYHGFDGADKVFMMEFSMPSAADSGFNGDMPAVWMLNAQIPRTLQYGSPTCSCWETGCGEFDIMEVLSSGATQCKSTFHTNTLAGDSDYIDRPTSGTIKIAVIFSSATSTAHIQVLDDSIDFGTSLTTDEIQAMVSSTAGSQLSLFTVP